VPSSSRRSSLSNESPKSIPSFPETVSVSAQRRDFAARETVGADPTLSSGHEPAQRRAARRQHHAHRHAGRDAYVILAAPAGDLLILVKRAAAPGATLARLAVAGDDGQGLSLRSRMRFSLVAALLIANANRPSQRGCGFAGIVPFD